MPIEKGDLIPSVNPVEDGSSGFWEVVSVSGEGLEAIVKIKSRVEKIAPVAAEGPTLVPVALMQNVKVYRQIDPFANDAVHSDKLATDYDSLGTNPRAWAKAMADRNEGGRLDETALLGWCSRMIEVGAARERALKVSPPAADDTKPKPPKPKPRSVRPRIIKKK